jgi:hypothetical protein
VATLVARGTPPEEVFAAVAGQDGRLLAVEFAVWRAYADPGQNQAAPLRPLPDAVTDLDHFRVRRRDRAGGIIHEYRLVA